METSHFGRYFLFAPITFDIQWISSLEHAYAQKISQKQDFSHYHGLCRGAGELNHCRITTDASQAQIPTNDI